MRAIHLPRHPARATPRIPLRQIPVTEPGWPEREADMALIRRAHELMRIAGEAASPKEAASARAEAEELMPAYAAATRRHNAAVKRDLAVRRAGGGTAEH